MDNTMYGKVSKKDMIRLRSVAKKLNPADQAWLLDFGLSQAMGIDIGVQSTNNLEVVANKPRRGRPPKNKVAVAV